MTSIKASLIAIKIYDSRVIHGDPPHEVVKLVSDDYDDTEHGTADQGKM